MRHFVHATDDRRAAATLSDLELLQVLVDDDVDRYQCSRSVGTSRWVTKPEVLISLTLLTRMTYSVLRWLRVKTNKVTVNGATDSSHCKSNCDKVSSRPVETLLR